MQAEGSKKRFIWLTVIGVLLNVAAIGYLRYQVTLPNLLHIPTSSQIRADMMSSCGIVNPAFCDSFSIPHPGGRGGDLDDSKWSFYRVSQNDNVNSNPYDGFPVTDEMFCKTPISGVLPDLDSFFCNNNGQEEMHWMTALNVAPYDYVGARIRQPFDFANRTGTIAFSVDAVTRGGHSWWPEIAITDTPVMGPHAQHPAVTGTPQNGVEIVLNGACNQPSATEDAPATTVGDVQVTTNYVTTDVASTNPMQYDTKNACVLTKRDNHNMFQIKISQNQIQVYGSDYNSTTLKLIGTFPVNLNFTRGYVNFQEAGYSAAKFNGQQDMTYHWHDIGFDGPVLPTPRSYEVADAMTTSGDHQVNVGWHVTTNPPTMSVCCGYGGQQFNAAIPYVSVKNVDLTNAQSAMLEFNTNNIGGGSSFRYQVNGNQWHTVVHPSTSNPNDNVNGGGWFDFAVPVPLNELQNGTNTIDFATDPNSNPAVDAFDMANIDLELFGDNITATPEPVVTPPAMADMDIIPSHTDENGQLIFGTAFPLSVTLHSVDLSADIAKAAGTVTLSSRLKVQSVTPGDCGMNFDKSPTTSDLSFSGTIPNTTTTACTVFTAMVMPTKLGDETQGFDYANLTNASIIATNGQNILAQTFNGEYSELTQPAESIGTIFGAGIQTWGPTFTPGQNTPITQWVNNPTQSSVAGTITNTITDPNGKVVASYTSSPTIKPQGLPYDMGTYTFPSTNPVYGKYTISSKVTSSDGATVYYNASEAGAFGSNGPADLYLLPKISESTSVNASAVPSPGTIKVTPKITMNGATPALVRVEVVDPNNQMYTQYLNNDQPISFPANTAVAQDATFNLPTNAPYGTYNVNVDVLSPDQQMIYYQHNYATTFAVAANALSITSPTGTYGNSITITGTKLSQTVKVTVTPTNSSDPTPTVSYPDDTHFQFTLPLSDTNIHNYTLQGFDSSNAPTPSLAAQIQKHKTADIMGDGTVDLSDLSALAKDWHRGKAYGDTLYDALSDLNGDGNVDIYDLSELAKYWGQ